jgi:hypothetical protein
LKRFEENGKAEALKQIKNVLICFSFDNWKQHRMIQYPDLNLWKYYIAKKIKNGFHEYKIVVELADETQIETYNSRCEFIVED